jgi:hypothetical protein
MYTFDVATTLIPLNSLLFSNVRRMLNWADNVQTGSESSVFNRAAVALVEHLLEDRSPTRAPFAGTDGGTAAAAY